MITPDVKWYFDGKGAPNFLKLLLLFVTIDKKIRFKSYVEELRKKAF